MNEKEILKMMDHINDDYLMEASATAKRKINLKKKMLTFGIAAALTASLSVGAVAAYKAFNRESVSTYYDSSAIDKIEQSGYVSDVTSRNEHFELTLDTVMRDDYSLTAVVTVKTLDEAAEKYLESSTQLCSELVYSDTGDKADGFAAFMGWQPYEKGKAYPMRLSVPVKSFMGSADLSRPIQLNIIKDTSSKASDDADLFKGLSLELKDVKQSKSAKFTAPSGKVFDISEFTISTDAKSFEDNLESDKLKIYYKDGTAETITEKINSFTIDVTADEKYVEIVDLKSFIDVDNIDHIEYLGENYARI